MILLQEIFLKVFNMSLTASIAILAVMLLRFLIHKAPKQYSYLLWGIVLFRLLCPISFQAPFSLLNFTGISANGIGEMEYASQSGIAGAQTQTPVEAGSQKGLPPVGFADGITNRSKAGEPSADGIANHSKTGGASAVGISNSRKAGGATASFSGSADALPETLSVPEADLSRSSDMRHSQPLAVCSMVWLLGIAALGIYSLRSSMRLRRQVACAIPLQGNIYLADHIPSPFAFGLLRPRIYLPSSVHEKECGYLVLHEQYHIRRRDCLVKPLAFLAVCLHWMNPLVWLAFALSMKDMEMSCDEAVVRRMGDDVRAEYAESLLRFAVGSQRISGIPLAFGEGNAKERIRNIMGCQKPAAAVIILALLTCLIGAACLGTNPASVPETLAWAQNLSQDDVASVALVAMPQEAEKQYRQFSPEEWEGVISLIRQSRGTYLTSHEDMEGGSIIFYLTMKDGTEHEVGNLGNTYLYIDGDYYDAGYDWLSSWSKEYGEGNARLPEDFYGEGEEGEELSGASEKENSASSGGASANDGNAPSSGGVSAEDGNAPLSGGASGSEESAVYGTFGRVRVSQEAYSAIWEAILEHNGGVYEGTDKYDVACCSFAGLETEPAKAAESDGAAGGAKPWVTYYGWAYYAEYKISEVEIEEVGASHVPVALTFAVDEDGCHLLKEYWEPSDGAGFVADVRSKFPPSVVEEGLDSQIFVERQTRECYAQAIASTQADAEPMVAHLLERICHASDSSLLPASSNPGDYIEAHIEEYRKLHYLGDETLKYCLKRFAQGGEEGLEGHIMARACERILEERWKMPIKASAAATGQEWYDALKAQIGGWEERTIAAEEEIPLSILKIGIPVQVAGGTGWARERKAVPSEENHLKIQYYDHVLEAQCTLWAAKDSELGLPAIEYDSSKEETWGAEDASGRMVTVRVQHAKGQVLASWEHGDYKFAISADVPDSQADTAPVPKMALEIVRQLE
ncbi:MAG: hypothetical protein HFH39_07845 [Lachnospiraceae bacterium]|nr:hypothetical protein [Lachnospiraceae bacterium]